MHRSGNPAKTGQAHGSLTQGALNFSVTMHCGPHQHAFWMGQSICECGAMPASDYVRELLTRYPGWVMPTPPQVKA